MNKEWSELNKTMQMQIKGRNSFCDGIMTLLLLCEKLIGQIAESEKTLTKEWMCAIPFINAEGYHSKTIAYSLYHIFRIEVERKKNYVVMDIHFGCLDNIQLSCYYNDCGYCFNGRIAF